MPPPAKSVPQGPVTSTVRPDARAPARQAAPPAPAAAAPVAAAVGRVLIRSSPSGEVRVNGIARGETPVVLRDLPFGQYAVTVTRAGFTPVEREVSLLASQPVASLSVDLVPQRPGAGPPRPVRRRPRRGSPGRRVAASRRAGGAGGAGGVAPRRRLPPAAGPSGGIFVVSTPTQARLFVDGQPYGNTPASIPGLSQGAHVVRVEAPGYRPWEGRVAVVAGTRVRVVATLQQGQE